jgi:glycerophosphoryl diester phosphodiesterase
LRRFAPAAAALFVAACGNSGPVLSPVSGDPQTCVEKTRLGPLVSAHRGGAGYAPENTLIAFQNAVRLGVDELEMDTQLTSDGELIVLHDDTLDRTTNCSGAANAHSLAEVKACDAAYWFAPGQGVTTPSMDLDHPLRGTGVTVPTLRELLTWYQTLDCNPQRLSIEIKNIPGESNFDPPGDRTANVLVPMLAEFGLQDQVVIQSFWPLSLDAVKRLNPSLKTQFLTTTSTGQTAAANLAYVIARGHDISAPNFDAPDFTSQLVIAAHTAGKAVIPYTPDEVNDQLKVIGLGVDGIITNFPACLLEALHRPLPDKLTPDGAPATGACPGSTSASPMPPMQDRPSAEICESLRPSRWLPAIGHAQGNAKLRLVGIQYKQDVRNVESYASFRTKMRCLIEDHVVPLMQPGLPMLVVFNEDIGLMTVATGTRGTLVRTQAATPLRAPIGDAEPVSTGAALVEMNAAYAPQVAAYQAMFGPIDPRKQVFVGATDTFVRAFSQTFSDLARDYGIYVVAANNMPAYRASTDPVEMLLFGDPEISDATEAYVATSQHVANTAFLWGPLDVHPDAPAGMKNLLFKNEKVPLTDIESTLIAIDEGPATGDAAIANAAGYTIEGFHLGFATSLPAFVWGYDFGERPADLEPCADMRVSYMPCMDALGVDVVVQDEANPGRWAIDQAGGWQPLEWMASTWRTVAEPSVKFRYNLTPMMVGNLLDLPFDGQSAITMRSAAEAGAHYIGNLEFESGVDVGWYQVFVGDKPEFLALAPWVSDDASRVDLRATAAKLAPGSGDALENEYLETAVWADLTR